MKNKKLIFIIIGLIIFSAIIGGVYWLLSKSNLMPLPVVMSDEACGDGVCSEIEKFSKNCEKDCQGVSALEGPVFGVYDPCTAGGARPAYNCDYKALFQSLKEAGIEWTLSSVSHSLLGDAYNDYLNSQGTAILEEIPQGFNLKFGEFADVDKMDLVRYSSQLKDYVKRFPYIKYWHAVEEADISQFWKDTPENYAIFLRIAYKSIKEANPEAKVVLGKCINCIYDYTSDEIAPEDYWMKDSIRQQFFLKALSELRQLEETEKNPQAPNKYKNNPNITTKEYRLLFAPDSFNDYFDIVAVGRNVLIEKDLKTVKDALLSFGYGQKPFWSIDIGRSMTFDLSNPDLGGVPVYSIPLEEEGAQEIVKTYANILSLGIEKIAYNGVFLNYYITPGDMTKRLEWFSHKLMAEKLKDFTAVEKLADGQYKFTFQNKNPVWVLWSDGLGTKTITLNVGNIPAVKITKAIPKYNTGKEVTDYNTAFETKTAAVSNGQLTLILGENPVYIEKK